MVVSSAIKLALNCHLPFTAIFMTIWEATSSKFYCMFTQIAILRWKQSSDWWTQNINNSGWTYCFLMYDLSSSWHEIPFSKQDLYVMNHLHLCVTNCYIFVCTITLLLFIMYLSLVNANISSNMIFIPITIFGQISACPMDLFLLVCLKYFQGFKSCIGTHCVGAIETTWYGTG